VEIGDRIRLGFERFNRRDWDAVARGLPDEFEAIDHLDARRAVGPRALQEITTANADTAFAYLSMDPVEILVLPETNGRVEAVVRVVAKGSGESSGIDLEGEVAQIWTFADGVPMRFEQFRTWGEARRAAGAD
jgi:hypothetical protein